MNTLQLTANHWISNGVAVIPVAYRDKRPSLPTWREFQKRLPTAVEVSRWFQSKFTNLAIVTGWRGLTVLDFDQVALYRLWRTWSIDAAPRARFSYTVETARGVHVYFFLNQPVQTMRAGTIDVKAGGGYVLAPPSIHPSGRHYRLLSDAPIMRVDSLKELLPAELLVANHQPAPIAQVSRVAVLTDDPWWAACHPATLADKAIPELLEGRSLFEFFPDAVRRGQRYWARCPLHDDRNASVTIDADGRRARCWAGCAHGDYLDWYAAINGLTLSEAIRGLNHD